ncbi:hypothetical protein VTK73DRAFT_9551 [Phialemonium thermophilum]|uniref:Uncharacterized protein n=1 Tax=Phialemonium thermophilum TaxID=223376 RepID=A0ABR3W2I5_9PEZI
MRVPNLRGRAIRPRPLRSADAHFTIPPLHGGLSNLFRAQYSVRQDRSGVPSLSTDFEAEAAVPHRREPPSRPTPWAAAARDPTSLDRRGRLPSEGGLTSIRKSTASPLAPFQVSIISRFGILPAATPTTAGGRFPSSRPRGSGSRQVRRTNRPAGRRGGARYTSCPAPPGRALFVAPGPDRGGPDHGAKRLQGRPGQGDALKAVRLDDSLPLSRHGGRAGQAAAIVQQGFQDPKTNHQRAAVANLWCRGLSWLATGRSTRVK